MLATTITTAMPRVANLKLLKATRAAMATAKAYHKLVKQPQRQQLA